MNWSTSRRRRKLARTTVVEHRVDHEVLEHHAVEVRRDVGSVGVGLDPEVAVEVDAVLGRFHLHLVEALLDLGQLLAQLGRFVGVGLLLGACEPYGEQSAASVTVIPRIVFSSLVPHLRLMAWVFSEVEVRSDVGPPGQCRDQSGRNRHGVRQELRCGQVVGIGRQGSHARHERRNELRQVVDEQALGEPADRLALGRLEALVGEPGEQEGEEIELDAEVVGGDPVPARLDPRRPQ